MSTEQAAQLEKIIDHISFLISLTWLCGLVVVLAVVIRFEKLEEKVRSLRAGVR